MGFSYAGIFRGHPSPPTRSFPIEDNGTNNDLGVTAKYLEEIYKSDRDNNWPPDTRILNTSLKNSGKSRADLWAFAANVALERMIERANFACDHDFNSGNQVSTLKAKGNTSFS